MRILENGVNWAFKAAIGVYVLVALVVGTSMGHKGPVWAVINGAAWPITLVYAALHKPDAIGDKTEGRKTGSTGVDPSMLATLSKFGNERRRPEADVHAPGADTGKPQKTPQELAQFLMANQTVPAMGGFSLEKPMRCFAPDNEGGNWSLRCRTILKDAERRGAPAMVDVQLYDHDVTFDNEVAVIKRHIADLASREDSVINSRPNMSTVTPQGREVAFPASCHQVLGSKNSPAYCGMLINPRTFVIVGVSPGKPSSRNVVVGSGDDNSADVKHAARLAFLGQMVGNYTVGQPSP